MRDFMLAEAKQKQYEEVEKRQGEEKERSAKLAADLE